MEQFTENHGYERLESPSLPQIPCTQLSNNLENENFRTFFVPLKMKIKFLHATDNFISIFNERDVIIYKYKIESRVILTRYRVITNHLLLFTLSHVSTKIAILLLNILNTLCERRTKRLRHNLVNIILNIRCRDISDYKISNNFLIIIDKYGNVMNHPISPETHHKTCLNPSPDRIKFQISNSKLTVHYSNRTFYEKIDLKEKVHSYLINDKKLFISGDHNLIILVFSG